MSLRSFTKLDLCWSLKATKGGLIFDQLLSSLIFVTFNAGITGYFSKTSLTAFIFLLIDSPSDLSNEFINFAASIFTLVVALIHPEQPI